MVRILALLCVMFLGFEFAWAEGGIEEIVGTEKWILDTISLIGTLKGASTLGIVAAVVQSLMWFFKTPLAAFTGKVRLLIVSVLSVASMVLAGMVEGMDFMTALGAGGVLAAVQVFVNQLWKQFFQKPDEVVHPVGK